MYVQGLAFEIQTPTNRNLNDRNMTTPLPVLSPGNIVPPPLSNGVFLSPKEKFGAPFKNATISNLFHFMKEKTNKIQQLGDYY